MHSRLSSPAAFRIVAGATAVVASLGFVALGVQLGTDGLGSDGPGRNPGSATASPAAAVVDLARTRPSSPTLEEQFLSLVPVAAASGFGSAAGGASAEAPTAPGAGPAPAAPGDGPGPGPVDPAIVPEPPSPDQLLPTDPGPLPDPVTVLDPVLAPVLGALSGGSSPETEETTTTEAPATEGDAGGLLETVQTLLGL